MIFSGVKRILGNFVDDQLESFAGWISPSFEVPSAFSLASPGGRRLSGRCLLAHGVSVGVSLSVFVLFAF